jgi:hypothetical protein
MSSRPSNSSSQQRRLDVEEQRACSVRRIGDVHPAAGELPREPTVDRSESQFATTGAGAGAGDVVEQPFQLGAREIRVENQSGSFAEQLGVPGGCQAVAQSRRASILPDDRPVQRLAAVAIPQHGRFSLIGDADCGDLVRGDAMVAQHGARDGQLRFPDLGGVVLDPSGLRVVLGKLLLRERRDAAVASEKYGSGTACALIEGENEC